ncbi:MAG TPA: hypothetical protein VKM72_05560 [Thermoanaerobaculia bacterium]|nr:hypothetical protein [Thermoanaerobaculia bacterium]
MRSRPGAGTGGDGFVDAAGVGRGSWFALDEDQRNREAELSAVSFFNTGPVSHELRICVQERSQETERLLVPPGRLVLAGEPLGLSSGTALAEIWEAGRVDAELKIRTLWLQDLLSIGPATFTLGLRRDTQDLGAPVAYGAETLSPRLGMTYALGPQRKTVLRATLARYTSQFGTEISLAAQPESLRAASFVLQDGEPPVFAFATNPLAISRDLAPEVTDEAALEVEYALLPEMLIGLRGTWRRTTNVLEERWLVRDEASGAVYAATSDDWIQAGTVDGVGWFDLRPGLEWIGSRQLANGDRSRDAFDLVASWNKRLTNRWMSRGHVAWHDWTWQVDPEALRFDDPTTALGGGDQDGQRVLLPAGGAVLPHEPVRFLGSRWSFHLMGTRQLPRGFNVSLAVDGHEGVPLAWYRQVLRERAGLVRVPVSGPGARTSDLVTTDFLLTKELAWDRDLHLTLSLDVFNLLNTGTVAERELDLGVGRAAEATRVVAPRTFRVGARVSWR